MNDKNIEELCADRVVFKKYQKKTLLGIDIL